MSQRFNNGNGAYTCDACHTIIRYGWPPNYSSVLKEPALVVPIPDATDRYPNGLEFCSTRCIERYANSKGEHADLVRVRAAEACPVRSRASSGGRVVHCKLEPYDVLIDRTTEWGNPFWEGTREENVLQFEELIRECFKLDPKLKERARVHLLGRVLGCWCKTKKEPDKLCHGDVWLKLIEEEEEDGHGERADEETDIEGRGPQGHV